MEEKSPSNSPAQTMSRQAVLILKEIQDGALQAKELSEDKRKICIRFLMSKMSYTNFEIGELMDMSLATVKRWKAKVRDDNAIAALVMDEGQMAMEIIEAADLHAAALTAEKKHFYAWVIRKEAIQLLQTMGYIKKVAEKLNVKGQLSLLEVLEVEKIQRENQSPDNGEDHDTSHINGNGHSTADDASRSRVEEFPQ